MPSWFGSKSSPKTARKKSFENIFGKLKQIREENRCASGSRHSSDSFSDGLGFWSGSRSPTAATSVCPTRFDDTSPAQPHPLPCAPPLASGRTDSGKDVLTPRSPSLPLPSPEQSSNTEDVLERDGRVPSNCSGSTSSLSSQESTSVMDVWSNNGSSDLLFPSSRTSHGDVTEGFEQNGFGIMPTAVSPRYGNMSPRQDYSHGSSPIFCQRVSSSPGRAYSGNYADATVVARNALTGNLDSPARSPKTTMNSDHSFNTLCRGRISPERSPAPSPRRRSPGPSPRILSAAVSPLHPRAAGGGQDSPSGRHDNGAHPLPLPPGSIAGSSVAATAPFSAGLRSPGRVERPINLKTGWRKGSLLGTGTFGQVYTGFHSETGQSCAIKEVVIIQENERSMESAKQLSQEVSLLSQMKHSNIVQYYGSEMIEDRLYIYLELMSNGSIHKLIQQYGPLEESCIRVYTRQILCGLYYLHCKNTVHRDIKGANILVDKGGVVKLADFGMAKHISAQSFPLSFKGSPYWMAPEVIRNTNGYDFAVDIWSLGCTVLEMANGKPPWSQFEGIAAVFKIGNSKEIPAIPDFLSEDGKAFVTSCLQRDPHKRPTAAQLLDHPFLNTQPSVSEVVTSNMQRLSVMESKGQVRTLSQSGNTSVPASPSASPKPAGRIAHHNVTTFAPSSPLAQVANSSCSTPRTGANGSSTFHGDGLSKSSPMHEILVKSPRSPKSHHLTDGRNHSDSRTESRWDRSQNPDSTPSPMHETLVKSPRSPKSHHLMDGRTHSDIRTKSRWDRSQTPDSTPPRYNFSVWDEDILTNTSGHISGDGGEECQRPYFGNVPHGAEHYSHRSLQNPQHYGAKPLQPVPHTTLGRAKSHEFGYFTESRYRD